MAFLCLLAGMVQVRPLCVATQHKYGSFFCPKPLSVYKQKVWAKASPVARSHPPCYFYTPPSIPEDACHIIIYQLTFSIESGKLFNLPTFNTCITFQHGKLKFPTLKAITTIAKTSKSLHFC